MADKPTPEALARAARDIHRGKTAAELEKAGLHDQARKLVNMTTDNPKASEKDLATADSNAQFGKSFKKGGPVDQTGLYTLHAGEFVVPANVASAPPMQSNPTHEYSNTPYSIASKMRVK